MRRSVRSRLGRAVACACCCAPLTAQAPPGPPIAVQIERSAAVPADGSPAAVRLAHGEAELAAGRPREALRHMLAALELHPASPAILRALVRASADDPDARAVYGLELALASCDARGRVQIDRADRELLPPKDPRRDVAEAQAAAIAELARYAGKLKADKIGDGVVARWAADLALDLGRDAAVVLDAQAAALGAAVEESAADFELIFAALRRLLDARSVGSTTDGEAAAAAAVDARERALRAARILSGLAAQAGFGDELQGPPPPELGDLPQQAHRALARIRAAIAADAGEPWTVAELRALSPAERAAFTAAHDRWTRPAVAVSPNGRYTIWTTCGFETLLGAAATVEDHHERLARWFGLDPFAQRSGTVRIEPEHDGLEANAAPFWWAGGFQSGDLTTLRFAWGSIEQLGRTLTHELTHRFDGALHAFLPAWLVEGRAVWTARSYAQVADPAFAENHLSPHAIQGPYVKGYGGVERLTELLDGTIDDYRDNYTAGYALFAYLKTWIGDDGRPLFAEPLARFMKNARGGRTDPVGFFVEHFADGEGGRPAGLEGFALGFREFMHQCYRWSWGGADRDAANAFITDRYRVELKPGGPWGGRVMDAPTLGWARGRAEPWFGQGHALPAAVLLAESGDAKAAAAAACWSLQVDGWRADHALRAAELLDAIAARDAAWACRCLAARRFSTLEPPAGEAPMLARLPRTRALLSALREAAEAQARAGHELAAAAFAERHYRVAAAVGAERLARAAPAGGESVMPRLENPRTLGDAGWIEDGLTGYEERRVPGLWYETEPGGDLHVGRARPREATGVMDRAAHQRHAFVRSVAWQAPGRYVLRARLHFTTSFVASAVVFGWTRRDRNLRLAVSAGDFLYSIGRKADDAKTKAVELRLDALWERDAPLLGNARRRRVEFAEPSGFVDLELRVDGPTVDCFAMGEHVFSYTTPDLSPIEGAIGFATGQGAVRVQTPSVQRLDRGALRAPDDPQRSILDLVQRPLPGLPRSPSGTLVIWLPRDAEPDVAVRRAFVRLAKPLGDPLQFPQPWVVMAPGDLSAEVRASLDRIIRAFVPAGLPVLPHLRAAAPEREVWVLFVDQHGVVRAAGTPDAAMPVAVAVWARHHRPPVGPGSSR